MIKRLYLVAVASILLPLAALAQTPATTTITDTVYAPDQSLFSGTIVITCCSQGIGFKSADGYRISGYIKNVTVTSGALSVGLVPNVGGIPPQTSYVAKYFQGGLNGPLVNTEAWLVPSSLSPITLSLVISPVIPFPRLSLAASQITGTPFTALQLLNGAHTASRCVGTDATGSFLIIKAGDCVTSGSGITTLGVSGSGQTGSTQTIATGTAGTDFGITSVANVHTFNLPTVSGSNRGLVTSALFNTWNGKQDTISSFSPVTNEFLTGFTAPNTFLHGRPTCANLSDSTASCALDATNATNIGSGTLNNLRLSAQVVLNNQANTYSGGGLQDFGSMKLKPPTTTVGSLPAASGANGQLYIITDGASSNDCTTGSGSTPALCRSNGTTWLALSGGGNALGDPGANGIVFRSAANITRTVLADDISAPVFCSATGTGTNPTAYASCALSPTISSYVSGTLYRFKADVANTGGATVNLGGGVKTIKKIVGGVTTDLVSNDIRASEWVNVIYDGTNMQLFGALGNGIAGSGTVTEIDTQLPIEGGPITTNGIIACSTCVTSVGAVSPLASSGGTTPQLSISGIIGSAFGGTGNGFTKFVGPATIEKSFTLPDANASILTDNALVTVAQGGHGAAPGGDDQVFVSSSTTAGAWKTVPDCPDAAGKHANYTQSTNTWSCGTSSSGGVSTQVRTVQFQEGAIIVTGTPTTGTVTNDSVVKLPNAADSSINVWFRVPDDAAVANDIFLEINYAPDSAPGVTNNKVKLITTATVNNTAASATAGDTITMANNTNWAAYLATNDKIAASTYAVGDYVQLVIKRDTTVGNNAAVAFDIGRISFKYTSIQ